ncbi:TPA: hypothetical protein I7682_18100 [Vibrio vulnificus]|nr:hypothetical protein [Vibrio vulnificus]
MAFYRSLSLNDIQGLALKHLPLFVFKEDDRYHCSTSLDSLPTELNLDGFEITRPEGAKWELKDWVNQSLGEPVNSIKKKPQ